MFSQIFDDIAQQFSRVSREFNGDSTVAATRIKALLQSVLQKMDLVSREEFDAQTAVLQRTRMRLQALEKQIAELECRLAQNKTGGC